MAAHREIILTEFNDLGLARPITQALVKEGHTTPTPIQQGAIPPVMEGRDLIGVAQTGTGKTAAFALPILHKLATSKHEPRRGDCRVVVLAPTRELAGQVLDRFHAYGKNMRLRTALVIGGASMGKQKTAARNGLDILVATPGRLLDLMRQNAVNLDQVEVLVLDEVDQMLDLGFVPAIRTLTAAMPSGRQSIFLSATMPPAIAKLANSFVRNPVKVEIAATKALKIDQSVIFMERPDKAKALLDMVSKDDFSCGLVFTKTKHGADKVTKALNAAGANAHAIHGNRSQAQRERALNAFRSGKAKILVATDIAARGIDVSGISHVINYDLPNVPETYVHRIGRTARAGAAGTAISFCAGDERPFLRSIERLTQQRISVVTNDAGVLTPVYRPDAGASFGGNDLLEEGEPRRGGRSAGGPGQAKRKQHRKGQNRGPRAGEQLDDKPGQPFRKKFKSRSNVNTGEQHKADHSGVKTKAAANGNSPARTQKGQDHGERGTAGVRRRRNRGAAGRELSRHAG